MKHLTPLILLIALTGCSTIPLSQKVIGDDKYAVKSHRLMGVHMYTSYDKVQSRRANALDKVYKFAFWMIAGGLLLTGVSVGVCLAVSAPFVAGWCKVGMAVGVSTAAVGLLAVGVPWYVWLLGGLVTVGASHYMHKYRDKGVDKVAVKVGSKVSRWLEGTRDA